MAMGPIHLPFIRAVAMVVAMVVAATAAESVWRVSKVLNLVPT